jgi:phospholipase A-2-activating protein
VIYVVTVSEDGGTEGTSCVKLEGHTNRVTSLTTLSPTKILSGSWDGTGRIWNLTTAQCTQVLSNHNNGVNVLYNPVSNVIYTAQAGRAENGAIVDCSVKYWEENSVGVYEVVNEVQPHTMPIRGVVLSKMGLVTVSNDSDVCVLDLATGNVLQRIACDDATSPFLLCVDVINSTAPLGDIDDMSSVYEHVVTGSENGHVFITSLADSNKRQTLPHPGTVWCVNSLENGDIVTGCDDGKIRVFTRDAERIAEESVMREYEAECENFSQSRNKGPSDDEISKLEKWENHHGLQKPEGTVQVFNKAGKAIAARYESGNWIEVGEVTSFGNKSSLNGVEYDHVLDIEIDVNGGGVKTLQCGYNNGDNPFVAAQKFIDDNELSQTYLGQIADYIQERCGKAKNNVIDMQSGAGAGAAADTNAASAPMEIDAKPSYVHIPNSFITTFTAGEDKVDKVTGKIFELYPDLNATDVDSVLSVANIIKQSSRYHSTTIVDKDMLSINRLLTTAVSDGNPDKIFPIVDLCRLASCHPSVCTATYASYWSMVIDQLLPLMSANAAHVAVCMLGCRLMANLLKPHALSTSDKLFRGERLVKAAQVAAAIYGGSDNKNVRGSALAVLANLAVMANTNAIEQHAAFELSTAAVSALRCATTKLNDADAARRCLLALGTIALGGFVAQVASTGIDDAALVEALGKVGMSEVVGEVEKAIGGF